MAQIQHKDQGDIWTPQATFTVAGVATDPTNITVRVKKPDGTVTVLGPVAGGTGGGGITRVSAGVFKTDITLDDAGYWFARFEGTGTAAAAEDHQAIVDPSEFYETAQLGTRALVGMAEARDWLQHNQQEAPDGLELARVINDVSDRIHYEAAREFKVEGVNPQVRLFPIERASQPDPWYIDGQYMGDRDRWNRTFYIGDLAAAPTLVEILDQDWTTVLETVPSADMAFYYQDREGPNAGASTVWPITAIEFHSDVMTLAPGMRLRVTGTWGFPAVPGNIRDATLDAIAAKVDRDVESYSTDLAPMQQQGEGTNVIIMGRSPRLLSLPPAALAVAWSYRPRYIA